MSKSKRALFIVACICLVCGMRLDAKTITVSATAGNGQYTSIQKAVNAAIPGDIVKIIDAATYKEQVTIDSTKDNLTLTSSSPTSLNKPTIMWQDTINVHPKTNAESKIDSMINFDRNGALRILGVHNVTVNGIAVNGGGPFVYGYTGVWYNSSTSQYSDLVCGNAAMTIWVSGAVRVLNCDFSNAYIGINFKDRNQGGIFANANPSDLQPQNIVPMSGFGKTGNHVIEYNRIHNNSFGLYFESAWDLGSTIRYNMIFENHHQTDAFASKVKKITSSEGPNQPGGAMFFKDVAYSPLAIYNNTFWHNFLLLIGHWRPGYQHLIFNNIYAKPFRYWPSDSNFSSNAYMDISVSFPNRMYNCVYSSQIQAPSQYYVSIMNGFPQVSAVNNVMVPGTLLSTTTANTAFPATANIRWLEMDSTMFLSMDPASVNFLTPNWTDTNISTYIKNQGWQKSGVKNVDGSWADLGAISSDGGRPVDFATIRPVDPVSITGTSATVKFSLEERSGKMLNPAATMFRFVSNLPVLSATAWANVSANIITTANINDVTLPSTPALQVGVNSYTVTLPVTQTTDYAFFETFIEGTGSDGNKYTTSTGFLPYRKLDYKFVVEVWNYALTKKMTEVTVGDTVILKVTAYTKDGTKFLQQIIPVSVGLSQYTLWSTLSNPPVALTYPNGITATQNSPVMFTKVPNGGIEIISVTGIWTSSSDTTQKYVFQGSTDIRVLAGPPATVVFQDPPSKTLGVTPPVLNPGLTYSGDLYVYDKYGNKITSPASVKLSSLTPTIALMGSAADTTITTDSSGVGRFSVKATNAAKENDLVTLQAFLATTNYYDTAYMTVGKRAEYLVIFYGDTNAYNASTKLSGEVGDRLLVTIIATKAGTPSIDSISAGINTTISISGTSGLVFYDSYTSTTSTTSFTMVNGRASVWVSSTDTINNGKISATASEYSSFNSPRDQIYFTRPAVSVDSAFYYSRTGFGMVDSVDIYYAAKLGMIPDSITLFWPGSDTGKRVIAGTSTEMTLAADSSHLTIVLANPFATEITASIASASSKQGISYDRPNNNPGVQETSSPFAIKDRVGPLVMAAQVVERIPAGTGIDTMYVSFSEDIKASSLVGNSLILIKNGVSTTISILAATATSKSSFKLTVSTPTPVFGPVAGDSLRIEPTGPITDALGNSANLLNRPVVITVKAVPASIVYGYYLDNYPAGRADGVVDSVVIKFNKNIGISDAIISLDWGSINTADSIPSSYMNYVGGDSSLIEINVRGRFKNIADDSIKTSGGMTATVLYRSIPGEPVQGSIADSAGPVAVDTAIYYPGVDSDSVYVTFSEPLASISQMNSPFNLWSITGASTYSLNISNTTLNKKGNKPTYLFNVKSIVSGNNNVKYPYTGDSLWINSNAGVTDNNGKVQTTGDNHKVPVNVKPIETQWDVTIDKNPYTPQNDSMSVKIVIQNVKMVQFAQISASGKIYDVLGNCIHVWEKRDFDPTGQSLELDLGWNGCNMQGRLVGSGVYIADINVTSDGKNSSKRKRIGVKR